MTIFSKVALSYLKYCSAIETARDEFAENMRLILGLSKKVKVIKTEMDNGLKYVRIDKPPYYLYFGTYNEKMEIGIGKDKDFQEPEVRGLKLKIKGLKGGEDNYSQYVYKEYQLRYFKKGAEEFIKVFRFLTKN